MVEVLEQSKQSGRADLENAVTLAFLEETKGDSKPAGGDKPADATSATTQEKAKGTKAGGMLKETADAFEKATDKAQAAKDLGPKFEAAIKQADADYATVEKNATKELTASLPAIRKAAEELAPEYQKVGEAFLKAGIPLQKMADIAEKLEKYNRLNDKDPAFAGVEKDLKAYPDLLKAAQSARKVFQQHKPVVEKAESTFEELAEAANDRIRTRGVYSESLKKAGDNQKSKEYEDEAQKVKKEIGDRFRKLMS